jgi:putative membrane protein
MAKMVIYVLVFLGASYTLPGVHVKSFWVALLAAFVLGILNFTLKPLLLLITLPINFVTLGLFTFVINALMILLVSAVVSGFVIDGFLWALALALIISAVKFIIF